MPEKKPPVPEKPRREPSKDHPAPPEQPVRDVKDAPAPNADELVDHKVRKIIGTE